MKRENKKIKIKHLNNSNLSQIKAFTLIIVTNIVMLILIGILVLLGPKIQIESIFNQKVQLTEIQTRKKNVKITT